MLSRPFSLAVLLASLSVSSVASAAYTRAVAVGSFQSTLGCTNDSAACAASELAYDSVDDVWQRAFALPSGSFTYRIAAETGATTSTFGLAGVAGGASIALALPSAGTVKIYFEPSEHAILDSRNNAIAVAAGSFQSELGCPGDWQPDCLRSVVFDPDGDGLYERRFTGLPQGTYEALVALNESWTETYGAGGASGGGSIALAVPPDPSVPVFARYVAATHVLTFETRALSKCALDPMGQPVAGTASPWKVAVRAAYGTPAGVVRTFNDGVEGPTAALGIDATASSSATFASAGQHVFRVEYAGDEFLEECTAEATLTVTSVSVPDAGSDAGASQPGTPDASTAAPDIDAGTMATGTNDPAAASNAGGGGCSLRAANGSFVGALGIVAALAGVRRRRRR